MSKIAVSSPASGTATYTISAPAGSTDRTISLPDNTGTILTTATAGVPINGPLLVSGAANQINVSANTFTAFTSFFASITDTASCFNTANGRFTPTVAGWYSVIATVSFGNLGVTSVAASANIYKNGATYGIAGSAVYSSGAYPTVQTTGLVYLNGTTDYVQVYTYVVTNGANNVSAQLQAFLARSAT
jgi:hypothetical protein